MKGEKKGGDQGKNLDRNVLDKCDSLSKCLGLATVSVYIQSSMSRLMNDG